MAFNPNAVFISPSSLADFDRCPQLYYFRNVYRSPRGFKIQIINPSLSLGQAVHEALELFTALLSEQKSKDELLAKFEFVWGNLSGEKGGFTLAEEEKEYKKRAFLMLDRFWNNKHFQQAEPVKIPGFPKAELGDDIILTGKLDWLEKDETGYHLVDFKTGKNEEKEDSIQLPVYALLISQLFKTDKIRASYWYLDKDEEIVDFSLPPLDEIKNELKTKGQIIKMARQTSSFRCQSGKESCWACRDFLDISKGKGKLVSIDPVNRKQEIYIIPKVQADSLFEVKQEEVSDLPF